MLDNLTLCYSLRQNDAFLVVLQTCEYLVWISVEKAYERNPFLLVILETHDITLEHGRPYLGNFGMTAQRSLLLLIVVVVLFLLFYGYHHA